LVRIIYNIASVVLFLKEIKAFLDNKSIVNCFYSFSDRMRMNLGKLVFMFVSFGRVYIYFAPCTLYSKVQQFLQLGSPRPLMVSQLNSKTQL
jgi:hypothetical protein